MLGSNNYLGLTGDARVVQGAQRRARRLRHGPDRLAPAQRHDRRCTSSSSASSPSGWAPRTRSSSPPATRRTSARSARSSRRATPSSSTPATTPRSSTACLLSRAKMRPFRHNKLDKLEKALERAQEDGGGVLVVVDGVYSMEGDVAPLRGDLRALRALRRPAHGRRGARRRRARRARRRGVASCSASRTASTCGWARSRSRWPSCGGFVAGQRRGRRLPADLEPRLHLHGVRRCRRRSARRSPRCASCARAEGPDLLRPRARQRAVPARRPARARLQDDRLTTIVTPVVPVLVEDDWKAALLWRALYDAGVFVNVAIHPAVPPGGALLRTSVMATHDEATLDRALDAFASVKHGLRGRTRTATHGGALILDPVSRDGTKSAL